MSYDNNQSKQGAKNDDFQNSQNNANNPNKSEENSLLLKPIAIKQALLPNNQTKKNINKYPGVSVIYQNAPTSYLNDINTINYKNSNDNLDIINPNNEIKNEKGAFSSFPNYNNGENNKINNIINERGENCKIHCTCKKTKCIKKYCECYSSNVFCYNCKCENCENKSSFFTENNNINNINNINIINNTNKKEEEIKEKKEYKSINENTNNNNDISATDNDKKKIIICTCLKSGCNKNYCECFKAKVKCNNKCRCIKCQNKPDDSITLNEDKMIRKIASAPINNIANMTSVNNITNTNNPINLTNFTIQRISVNINKVQTIINTEKLDYFDSHKFLCKKRKES